MNDRYIANSRASKEALKSANLLKSININALITGQKGVGKKSLASYVIDAPVVDGANYDELLNSISANSRLIIKNFDKIKNYNRIKELIDFHKTRIIATSCKDLDTKIEDMFFSLKIHLPPLSERLEDVKELSKKFYEDAKEIFDNKSVELDLDSFKWDLSLNCYSLRRDIFKEYVLAMLEEEDILRVLEKFFYDKIGSGNDYRELLYMFDVPLIKSGFKKFHSQLSISKEFGLNRNTLRKKINDYKDKL